MKSVCVLGSHGIPANYGGFETFAEQFAMDLAGKEYAVAVVGEFTDDKVAVDALALQGIRVIFTRFKKSRNPVLYYIESALRTPKDCSHAVCLGPGSIFSWPILATRGIRMLVNMDGLNSRRQKWPRWKRFAFLIIERLAAKLPCDIILDSTALLPFWKSSNSKNNRISVIEYGSTDILHGEGANRDETVLAKYGLKENAYFLVVARLVPENSIGEIVAAHAASETLLPLIVLGNWDPKDYETEVCPMSRADVHFLGAIHNQGELAALRRSCFAYIHGHKVGGTNPSLVEALASGRPIIAHGNDFNRATLEGAKAYFFDGSFDLTETLDNQELIENQANSYGQYGHDLFKTKYTWAVISDKYLSIINREKRATASV